MTLTTDTGTDLQTTIDWLESQFDGWSVSVATTKTGKGDRRPLWIARADGHHPQAALTASKLHTRLSDYETRLERRRQLSEGH